MLEREAFVDIESVLISLGLAVVAGAVYRAMRKRSDAADSAPQHFFGAGADDTMMAETRTPASELPSQLPPSHKSR
jgi:hypothetical protein